MIELTGKYNSCKIFTDNVDEATITQVTNLLDQEFISNSKVRIMPDCHAGKGCVISAQNGERCIIPMNMRDGSLICIGKGNPDWNYSAPHGAGRLMSRTEARSSIGMKAFKESMDGIYSSTIMKETIDEAPMVYKPIDEIMENIKDTVSIEKVIKPIYNFKSADNDKSIKKKEKR